MRRGCVALLVPPGQTQLHPSRVIIGHIRRKQLLYTWEAVFSGPIMTAPGNKRHCLRYPHTQKRKVKVFRLRDSNLFVYREG
jgi:hypothetical protein